jgi:hypothetical protein
VFGILKSDHKGVANGGRARLNEPGILGPGQLMAVTGNSFHESKSTVYYGAWSSLGMVVVHNLLESYTILTLGSWLWSGNDGIEV